MRKYFLFFILLSHTLLLSAETVYVWGYGDILGEALQSIKYVFASGAFLDSWKAVIALTLVTVSLFSAISREPTAFLKMPVFWFLSAGVWTLFVVANVDIYIEDKTNPNNNRTVTHVPFGVGYFLAKFSQIELEMGTVMETMFSVPNDLSFTQSGLIYGASIFKNASSHRILDPNLSSDVEGYIIECVMPDLLDGYKSYDALIKSDELWIYLGDTNPARFVYVHNAAGEQNMTNCINAYNTITGKLNTYIPGQAMQSLDKLFGTQNVATIEQKLGIVNSYYFNSSKDARNRLLQYTTMNNFEKTYNAYRASGSADLASAQAQSIAQTNMQTQASMGEKYIPIFKGILTVIVAALTPILVLLMITPIGFNVAKGYLMTLIWLSAWHIGDVVLNFIINVKMQSLVVKTAGEYTYATKAIVDSSVLDYIEMAGSMYWMIPTIAGLLVGGFSWLAVQSFSQGMSSIPNSAGSSAAGTTALGNVSMGNVSYDTLSGNKIDPSRYYAGGSRMMMQNGFGMENSISNNTNFRSSSVDGLGKSVSGFQANDSLRSSYVEAVGYGAGGIGIVTADQSGGVRYQNIGNHMMEIESSSWIQDKSGNMMKPESGAIMKTNPHGTLSPQNGYFTFAARDDDGKLQEATIKYNDGKAVEIQSVDAQTGAKISITERGGQTVTEITKGQGNTMTLSDGKVISATLNGLSLGADELASYAKNYQQTKSLEQFQSFVDSKGYKEADSKTASAIASKVFDAANTKSERYADTQDIAKNVTLSAVEEVMLGDSKSQNHSSNVDKSKSSTESGKAYAGTNVKFDSSENVLGALINKVTGGKASSSTGYTLDYITSDGFSIRTSEGESVSHTFSQQEKDAVNKSISRRVASSHTEDNSISYSSRDSDQKQTQFSSQIVEEVGQTFQAGTTGRQSDSFSKINSFSESDRITINKTIEYLQDRIDHRDTGESLAHIFSDTVDYQNQVREKQKFSKNLPNENVSIDVSSYALNSDNLKSDVNSNIGKDVKAVEPIHKGQNYTELDNEFIAKNHEMTQEVSDAKMQTKADFKHIDKHKSTIEQMKFQSPMKDHADTILNIGNKVIDNVDYALSHKFDASGKTFDIQGNRVENWSRRDDGFLPGQTEPQSSNQAPVVQENRQPSIPGQPTGDVATVLSQDKLKVEGVSAVFDKKIEPQQAHQNQSSQTVAKEAKEEVRKSRPIVPDK